MRLIVLSLFTVLFISCGTNRAVYQSPDFENTSYKHKTIAVLPVRMIHSGHVPKNVTEADIKAANENWGYAFQESLQSYILKQTAKKKKGNIVSFQSTQKTNALLKESGIEKIEDLYNKTPEALAKILNVDAVIMTTLNHNKNFSDGVAYGVAAARTVVNVLSKTATVGTGVNASDVDINCSLYDAKDSKLLWKTFRSGGTDLPANVDGLVEFYSNWIAKKLPYKS
jgi:hypothetical protein